MADEHPPRPPFADEATRLLGMLQEWTRQTFPAAPEGHEGSAAPVCQWCPLCQFMSVLRGDRPEVTERVAEAGSAIAAALRSVLDAATSASAHDEPEPAPRVQRIDLGNGSGTP
ncbi:MAG TPA: hypothetical protein VIG48_09910 [Jatrophihabitans sp.]|jgi:hypothetical protein